MTGKTVLQIIPPMKPIRAVIDTNVFYAALYSESGASNALVSLIGAGRIRPCLSVALFLEYEERLNAARGEFGLTREDISAFLDYVIARGEEIRVFYLWRPHLRDPCDDMILELAVAARVRYIVTHNIRDFIGADRFGINAVTPGWFLKNLGGLT